MIEIVEKKDCCGCGACEQRCPKQCITMQEDHEGFLYPSVDLATCNDCGLCEKVCPVLHQGEPRKPLHVYAAKNKNEQIRKESSSGGIFTLLAEAILAEGGVIFGARFNDKWEVIHDYIETIEGLSNFRGSKYVQSKVGETFKQTEIFLKEGRKVLYSGTPCQVAGLKRYLRKEYDNLLAVDFVCHGVPSPKVFRLYLEEIINKLAQKGKNSVSSLLSSPVITSISFRDKSCGWKKYGFVLRLSDPIQGTDKNTVSFSETIGKNIFMRGFLHDLYLRPSCHACPSKTFKSGSDITIADFWGIAKYHPEFDDDKGTSLILSNTITGADSLSKLNFDFIDTIYEQALSGNASMEKSVTKHKNRDEFFAEVRSGSVVGTIIKYTKPTTKQRLRRYILYIPIKILSKTKAIIKKI